MSDSVRTSSASSSTVLMAAGPSQKKVTMQSPHDDEPAMTQSSQLIRIPVELSRESNGETELVGKSRCMPTVCTGPCDSFQEGWVMSRGTTHARNCSALR